MGLLMQFVYLAIILAIGTFILFLRRKAKGSKSLYKLILILSGILSSVLVVNGFSLKFDNMFLNYVSIFLLVALMFELSTRLNSENIVFSKRSFILFFSILFVNAVFFTFASIFFLKITPLIAVVFAILMSSVEYLIVDELKKEGDFANPFLILFSIFVLIFYEISVITWVNIISVIQYILIGLGMGVLIGIIVFKSMKHHKITWFHEIGLLASALLVYILTESLGGSGIFAVMILGTFFGNSHVREKVQLKTLSPFIFKSLEILIFLLIGFAIDLVFDANIMMYSLILSFIYLLLRFIVITLIHKHYSLHNKLLLSFAPKGMVFAVMILLLSSYTFISNYLLSVMLYVLIFSLLFSGIIEFFEQEKIKKFDKVFYVLRHLRFGRKRDLKKNL